MPKRVFVNGLPDSFGDGELRRLFMQYGMVLSAEVGRDRGGQSLGFGYVEMATTEQASLAICSLNRSRVEGKLLQVLFAERAAS
jgi:RNA recognition motif-containing protein